MGVSVNAWVTKPRSWPHSNAQSRFPCCSFQPGTDNQCQSSWSCSKGNASDWTNLPLLHRRKSSTVHYLLCQAIFLQTVAQEVWEECKTLEWWEESSQTWDIPLMGHKESLHVQVLAGDALRRWHTLTVIGCHQGHRGRSALVVRAGTHRWGFRAAKSACLLLCLCSCLTFKPDTEVIWTWSSSWLSSCLVDPCWCYTAVS